MYRDDPTRSGFVNQAFSPDLHMQILESRANAGIHGASKASVIGGPDGYLTATDSGWLTRMDRNGKEIWSLRTLTAAFGFNGTPARRGDILLIGDYHGTLTALSWATGKIFWILQLGDTLGASPLLTDDGGVIVSVETRQPDGYLAKIDIRSGATIWTSPWFGEQGHSSPALAGGIVVVGDNAGSLSGYNEKTGLRLWRLKTGGPIKSTPAIHGSTAYASSWDGMLYAVDVTSGILRGSAKLDPFNQSSTALLPNGEAGFINTRNGLCRLSLKGEISLVCEGRPTGRAARKASPTITPRAGAKDQFLVWTACDETNFCVYEARTLKRLRSWRLQTTLSGEPRIADTEILIMTEREPGLVRFVQGARR
jgi:outer membrane protein assembly factor BamB